jgi:hypothetical protein
MTDIMTFLRLQTLHNSGFGLTGIMCRSARHNVALTPCRFYQ